MSLDHPGGAAPAETATMMPMLEHSYSSLPDRFFAPASPEAVPSPELLAWNEPLAGILGLADLTGQEEKLAAIFSGNDPLPGARPIALAYAGHQFGHFVPQLGDGRAVLLGEITGSDGKRYDLQLKGSGQTPFSRRGDGKSSLGPVIREYLLSEAMHRLGVPTTRALAAVKTGETVFRESALPGGVFTRVAASHIRVGTFEYFASRRDGEGLHALTRYAIERHYPTANDAAKPYVRFFEQVRDRQAHLVAHWMSIGFIHGVMNTDNTTVSGETLDYGPCAFMDEFRFDKVFSSIDHGGRYAYGNQPAIAQWNLARLAECLLTIDDDRETYETALQEFPAIFETAYHEKMAPKFGLSTLKTGDADLIRQWLDVLQKRVLDFTQSFRRLAERVEAQDESEYGEFETRWRARLAQQDLAAVEVRNNMNKTNPLFIPRNHQVERAIQGAIKGDLTVFNELLRVLSEPFSSQATLSDYAEPPRPEERVTQTFCGT